MTDTVHRKLSAEEKSEQLRCMQSLLDRFGYISIGTPGPCFVGEIMDNLLIHDRHDDSLKSVCDVTLVVVGESNAREHQTQRLACEAYLGREGHRDAPEHPYYYRALAE